MNSKLYCSLRHDFTVVIEGDEITYNLFQQDGATAHTAKKKSMKLLNEIFGERVISGNVWPPRSPDLTHPDIFVCGEQQNLQCIVIAIACLMS
jgi:hypothetical protein